MHNKPVSTRTLWLKAERLEEILGGIRESFGDDFEMIKVIVEVKDIESAKITVSKDQGTVISLKNKYTFVNPTVTEEEDEEDSEANLPFMEVELRHSIAVNFESLLSSEVLKF